MTDVFNPDGLRQTIAVLQDALALGFKSGSSPVDLVLEVYIDACLLLSEAFRLGGSFREPNPNLVKLPGVDALNNERLVFIRSPPMKIRPSLEKSRYFKGLAEVAVRLKKSPNASTFMVDATVAAKCEQEQEPQVRARSPSKHEKQKERQAARSAYYRRQRKKDS
jgi:hypothetical protein